MQGALQVNIGKTSARQNAALVFPVLGCFVLYIICAFGQRRTPCINTRIQHERALNAIAKRVSRGPKPLRGCRAALCWGQGAKPLGFPQSTREHSMKKRSTQSRERVKGGTPLWGQGARPLAESRGRASGVSYSASGQAEKTACLCVVQEETCFGRKRSCGCCCCRGWRD